MFGEIQNGIMKLNEYGQIVHDEWLKTPVIRPNVILDEFVVMPDHFHGIIGITRSVAVVGATRRVAPTNGIRTNTNGIRTNTNGIRTNTNGIRTNTNGIRTNTNGIRTIINDTQIIQTIKRPNGPKSGSIGAIIGQFKSMTTKRINRLRATYRAFPTCVAPVIIDRHVWQRNYYDHIIRDAESLNRIRQYIINNPLNFLRK
jgi:REP element-mobilizing transposase RayT